jgi:RNA polymerase sigma-70 factor (ECF subfamily)
MPTPVADIQQFIYRVAVEQDEAAYRSLFLHFYPDVRKFAQSIVKNPQWAEEIANDVLISLWRSRAGIIEINNLKAWLFTITRNLCLNLLKKERRLQSLSLDQIDVDVSLPAINPDEVFVTREMKRKLEAAILELPPKCRLIFRLVKVDGFSYNEVARILDISVKTVDAQLVTAIRKITSAVQLQYGLSSR